MLRILLALAVMGGMSQLATADDPPKKLTPAEQKQLEAKRSELSKQGFEAYKAGKYREAHKAFAAGLDVARQLYPKTEFPDGHLNLVRSLRDLGFIHRVQGNLAEAEPLYREAVTTSQQLFKDDHAEVANRIKDLANLYRAQGKLAEAESLGRDVLAMTKRLHKGDHAEVARGLTFVASLLQSQSKLPESERLYRESLDMRKRLFPKQDHEDIADNLYDVGLVCIELGKYADAESLYSEALEMKKRLFEGDNPEVAAGLKDLAFLYEEQSKFTEAEPLFRESLAMLKRFYKDDHPEVAEAMAHLASVYKHQWRHAEAETLYRDALAMTKRIHKGDHPNIGDALNHVAMLLNLQGKQTESESIYRDVLAMNKRLFKGDHPSIASSLDNLASTCLHQKKDEEAERLFRESLEMQKRLLPKHDSAELISSMDSLGRLYLQQGKVADAEPLFKDSLAMSQRLYKGDHHNVAFGLFNTANLRLQQGQYVESERLLKESLAMYKRITPNQDTVEMASVSRTLGLLYARQGKHTEAEPLLRGALQTARQKVRAYASQKAEGEALTFLANEVRVLDSLISLARESKTKPETLYADVYGDKCLVAHVYEQRQLQARAIATDPQAAGLLKELAETRRRRAELLLAPHTADPATQIKRDAALKTLDAKLVDLDNKIRPRLPTIARVEKLANASPAELQTALPADAVVIDFLKYTQVEYDPKKPGNEGIKRTERYAAFVVTKDKIAWVELDTAKKIEVAITNWREAITTPPYAVAGDIPQRVRELVWEPVRTLLPAGTKVVYICPAADLTRVPWTALPGDKPGTILLEDFAIAAIPHSLFLLDMLWPREPQKNASNQLLVVGGVKYDAEVSRVPGTNAVDPLVKPGTKAGWAFLDGTEAEAKGVSAAAGRKKLTVAALGAEQATTAAVLDALPKAKHAHFATHGFFADASFRSAFQLDPNDDKRGLTGERIGGAANSPLVMTGLVLAGANRPETSGRGILTGEGLIDLDLSGLDVAVLSACETGLGEVADGVGVFGLQRAFHLAGTRNVVASLWKVPDAATAALMGEFYRNLWEENLSPVVALQKAQLAIYRADSKQFADMARRGPGLGDADLDKTAKVIGKTPINKDGKNPPVIWAAFSLSGPGR
ncbi:MAG: CHAT domain-containing protein [Planctomycetes bacterium]|nr:CHAT domain-containing protein [Planctomycetota bacterium]